MYNHLQENKDETYAKEHVMSIHSNNICKEELEDPRVSDTEMKERASKECKNHDMTKPQREVGPP